MKAEIVYPSAKVVISVKLREAALVYQIGTKNVDFICSTKRGWDNSSMRIQDFNVHYEETGGNPAEAARTILNGTRHKTEATKAILNSIANTEYKAMAKTTPAAPVAEAKPLTKKEIQAKEAAGKKAAKEKADAEKKAAADKAAADKAAADAAAKKIADKEAAAKAKIAEKEAKAKEKADAKAKKDADKAAAKAAREAAGGARGPVREYGITPWAVINVTKPDVKGKGEMGTQLDLLAKYTGKTVEEFTKAGGERSTLRRAVRREIMTLLPGKEPAPAPAVKAA